MIIKHSRDANNVLLVENNNHLLAQESSGRELSAAIGLVSIIFFWQTQIYVGGVGVPIYLVSMPFLFFLSGITARQITNVLLLNGIFFFYFAIQTQQQIAQSNLSRTVFSLVALSLLFVAIMRWVDICQRSRWKIFIRLSSFLLCLQVALQMLEMIVPDVATFFGGSVYYSGFSLLSLPRASGFFSEPSHIGMGLSPYIFLVVSRPKFFLREFGIVPLLAIVMSISLSVSATSFLVVFLAFVLGNITSFKVGFKSLTVAIILSAIVSALLIFGLPAAFQDRLQSTIQLFSGERSSSAYNLSSLVLYLGGRMAMEALTHFPLGAGALNLSALYPFVGADKFPELARYAGLNSEDGASVLFKLVGEFGWMGVLLYASSIRFFFRANRDPNKVMITSMIFTMMAFSIRGASYFDGAIAIGLSLSFFGLLETIFSIRSSRYRLSI